MQYVVRAEEDTPGGALVSMTCGNSSCAGEEEYATGLLWSRSYYYLRASLDAID